VETGLKGSLLLVLDEKEVGSSRRGKGRWERRVYDWKKGKQSGVYF